MRALLLAVMISLAHSSAPQPAELLERMAARAIADTGKQKRNDENVLFVFIFSLSLSFCLFL